MFVPSAAFPVGGTTALFEFADGLARRGHEVVLSHVDFGSGITAVEDVWWHRFEASVEHRYAADPPVGDVVLSFDGRARPDLGRPFMWIQARHILPGEDAIYGAPCPKLCTSSWLRDVALAEGVGPAYHVPYGLRHGKWRGDTPWTSRGPVVSMLFNPHPVKGGAIGLAALGKVVAQRPDTTVVAYGTFPLPEDSPTGIRYLHNPPQDQIVELFGRSRVFVQPSLREGFGMACTEAMACGAALVTTDCGGSVDYADDDAAYVVAPGDVDALADAVLHALEEGEAKAESGRGVTRRFDWDRSAAILEAVIENEAADHVIDLDAIDRDRVARTRGGAQPTTDAQPTT